MSLLPTSMTHRTQTWSQTGPMTTGRDYATATLLEDGDVLVAGGAGSATSAELYDPSTQTWTATGSMSQGRYQAAATLLPDGDVLIVGGFDSNGDVLTSAELYNPGSGTWSTTGSMTTGRGWPAATVLNDGDVLVAGGFDDHGSQGVASAELYDPSTGTFSSTAPMSTPRGLPTATRLADGKVLLVGGYGTSSNQSSAELYDPSTQSWSAMPSADNPEGTDTTYQFELSTSPQFTSPIDVPATPADAGSGSSPVPVSQSFSGLEPDTTYYSQLVAANTVGSQTSDAAGPFSRLYGQRDSSSVRHAVYARHELGGAGGQLAQLEMRRGELLLEDLVLEVLDLGSDVASGVEAPALAPDSATVATQQRPLTSA